MQIKICGISDPVLATMTLQAGADLVGMVLTPTSKRYVNIEKAKQIAQAIYAQNARPVLVFLDESLRFITSAVEKIGDCIVQFQAKKHREMRNIIMKYDTIIAFSAAEFSCESVSLSKQIMQVQSKKKAMLLIEGEQPGSGKAFCWQTFQPPEIPWYLAGGLRPDNVDEAIRQLQPNGVDVSSGVENHQGKKDFDKILAFIQAAKGCVR